MPPTPSPSTSKSCDPDMPPLVDSDEEIQPSDGLPAAATTQTTTPTEAATKTPSEKVVITIKWTGAGAEGLPLKVVSRSYRFGTHRPLLIIFGRFATGVGKQPSDFTFRFQGMQISGSEKKKKKKKKKGGKKEQDLQDEGSDDMSCPDLCDDDDTSSDDCGVGGKPDHRKPPLPSSDGGPPNLSEDESSDGPPDLSDDEDEDGPPDLSDDEDEDGPPNLSGDEDSDGPPNLSDDEDDS
ncbi:hypothetical protein TrRE_jg8155, partial [Triparma retinervis]